MSGNTLNIDNGLRQPIEDLISKGHTAPWVVFCNSLAISSGEYESELGKVIVKASLLHTPVDDLAVTTLALFEQFEADNPPDNDTA